jgi:hypothetical protein
MKKNLATLLFLCAAVFITCGGNGDHAAEGVSLAPKSLLIYYGWPSAINGSATAAEAAGHFASYDYIVLGAGLEDQSHGDHAAVVSILSSCDAVFFGYVDLGVSTNNYTAAQIEKKISDWKNTGADGIFLDDYGFDYGVSRSRQNAAVAYAHAQGLPVVANAWNPDEAFGSGLDAVYNKDAAASMLDSRDFYLSESFQIQEGAYQSEDAWYAKAEKLDAYRTNIGFGVFSVTTNSSSDDYDEKKFFYSWYSALLYNHTAAGWGNYNFSSDDNSAPLRAAPSFEAVGRFTGGVVRDGHAYRRRTDSYLIEVNADSHTAGCTR